MSTVTVIDCSTGEVEVKPLPPRALDEAQGAKWASAKAIRDRKLDGGVTVPGIGTFDSDPVSRANVTGAVTMALIAKGAGAPFAINWKLADNSVTALNADQMIGVGVAIGSYVSAVHAHAQTLGLAIQGAEDTETVDSIDLTTGWP